MYVYFSIITVNVLQELEKAFKTLTTVAANVKLYAEKILKDSRHIEVQILADTHGDIVHFIETDGTIQRNHKKIIQISPGISLDRCVSIILLS